MSMGLCPTRAKRAREPRYKHQWNTRWAFTRKLDFFTCENNKLSSHVKISPLLWLHNRSRLSHQKLSRWNGLVVHWCLYNKQNITWPLGDTKFFFSCWKIFSTLKEKFRISARPSNILYISNRFFEHQLNKICSYLSEKASKSFLSPRSSKITITKEKERRKRKSEEKERRRREKSNGCTLSF